MGATSPRADAKGASPNNPPQGTDNIGINPKPKRYIYAHDAELAFRIVTTMSSGTNLYSAAHTMLTTYMQQLVTGTSEEEQS